jgi:hypothetical protein
MEKTLVTGTGRSGTTFLIKLFSFLGFDTGFDRNNYERHIAKNCNAGMEHNAHPARAKHAVLKSPLYMRDIRSIFQSKDLRLKRVIIPVREYGAATASRRKNAGKAGGWFNAGNEEDQLRFFHRIVAEYVYYMTKYDVPTIFLDFERMVTDKEYLYRMLDPMLRERDGGKGTDFQTFSAVYDEVSAISKPHESAFLENGVSKRRMR